MNSELEKLIEKYRITVNGLADLESGYDGTAAAAEKVIKERGFVTLNGLLTATADSLHTEPGSFGDSPAGEGTENAVNTENTPVAESDASHNEPTPVVPAPSDNSEEHTPVAPAPVENPGVTPVPSEPAVSDDTNLGTEVAASSTEDSSEEEDPASTEDSTTGGKPKKKKK